MATAATDGTTKYRIIRILRDGTEGLLGFAILRPDGWHFNSRTQTKNSRRGWPTAKACLPRGIAYDAMRAEPAKAEA